MRKIICVLLLSIITIAVYSQRNIDSLENVLKTKELTKKEKLNTYELLCRWTLSFDTDKMILYAEEGLQLARKEKDNLKISVFNEYIGIAYSIKRDFNKALPYYDESLKSAIESGDKLQEISVLISMGATHQRLNKPITGIDYFLKALSICEEIGEKDQSLKIVRNLAGDYLTLNNFERAEYYMEKALAMIEEIDNPDEVATTYYTLAVMYRDQEKYDEALEYGLLALEKSHSSGQLIFECLSMQLLATVYQYYEDYDNALRYAKESLELSKRLDEPEITAISWSSLADIYREQKKYKESEEAAFTTWRIDSTDYVLGGNSAINIVYANIHLGNKEKASAFLQKYVNINKKYHSSGFHEALIDMEVKYETEKKETRIATLEKEKQLYIWLGIAILLVLLLALGLLFIRHRLNIQKRKIAEQQRELAEQQVKQLEQEKKLVATQSVLDGETAERSRLARDLHDGLGGMLSVVKLNLKDVKNYSIMDGTDVSRFNNALEVLDQSIGELRRVAHHMMPESLMRNGLKISLEDFCKAIPNAHFQYLGNSSRLDDRLEIVLYRAAYELVNNALKYADAQNINVQLIVDDNLISLTVQDNGLGFDPEAVNNGTGLENIRTRVSAYNGKMDIYSSPGKGTEVSIEIESPKVT